MSNAVHPTFFNIPSFKEVEEAEKKGASEDEVAYYAMSKSKGWSQFSSFARNVMDELDLFNSTAIESVATFEDIGKNTLVISLVKDIIKRLLNKVEDAKEACGGADGGKE